MGQMLTCNLARGSLVMTNPVNYAVPLSSVGFLNTLPLTILVQSDCSYHLTWFVSHCTIQEKSLTNPLCSTRSAPKTTHTLSW